MRDLFDTLWTVRWEPLVLLPWALEFNNKASKLERTATWVEFPRMPLALYSLVRVS